MIILQQNLSYRNTRSIRILLLMIVIINYIQIAKKEHIFAQNPKPTFPSYGFSNEEEYFANIDRLGNLCLLEANLNKQSQNKLINQKKQYYQKSNIKLTKQLGFDIDNKEFNKSDIDMRTQDIINFCLIRWQV